MTTTWRDDVRMTHLDVVFAVPVRDPMLDSLVPFLSSLNQR
jgi:hypothetical protein